MTGQQQQRFARRNHGTGHGYTLDGHEIPGVTTIIGLLDKPALVGWAAEQSAGYAVENWGRLSELPLMERAKQIRNARFAKNRQATTKGTRIHAMAERLQAGEPLESIDVPLTVESQVQAVARFLDDWQMQPVCAEAPLCNTGYRYGGTLDSIVTSPRLGTILMDWKTGKGVYDETALQLAAYRAADLTLAEQVTVGPRGGRKTSWVERTMPEVDGCYVAHVLTDSVELHPVTADEKVLAAFLYLREVYDLWVTRTGWRFRDTPGYAPTVGAPIYPEDKPVKEQDDE